MFAGGEAPPVGSGPTAAAQGPFGDEPRSLLKDADPDQIWAPYNNAAAPGLVEHPGRYDGRQRRG